MSLHVAAQDSTRVFKTDITRQNNFTTSIQQFFGFYGTSGKTSVFVNQNQELLYNQTLATGRLVQGNAAAQVWIRQASGKRIQPVLWWESDAFLNNRNARSQLYAGIAIKPYDALELIPLYGYNIDVRNGRPDHGASPALFMRWQPQKLRDADLAFQGFSRVKYIAPRRQDNHRAELLTAKSIAGNSRVFMNLSAAFHGMDDYQSRSVQRLLSDTLNLQAGFTYTLMPGLLAEGAQRLTRQHRNYRFSHLEKGLPEFNASGFQQDELQSQIKLNLKRNKWMSYIAYEYILINRTYRLENDMQLAQPLYQEQLRREAEKNYRSAFQKWSFFSQYSFSRKHSVELEYSGQYLQYDTPLNTNFDDRDELTYIIRTAWNARWRSNFKMLYEVTGQSRYSGFLSGTRSRDNYYQYNLKFRSAGEWRFHPLWTLSLDQAVYVTYNVKVFGDPQFTDRSARFLEHRADMSGQWHHRWRSTFLAERKVQMLSYLNWEQFSENPLDTTWFINLQHTTEYMWGGKGRNLTWSLAAGFRHFIQQRHLIAENKDEIFPNNTIRLQMINRQSGPLSDFILRSKRGNRLSISIWWQRQKVFNQSESADADLYPAQAITYRELQNVQRILRPYFDIRALIVF